MLNKRTHIILYGLLFVYVGVSVVQYFHFNKEINKRIERIENLSQIYSINDKKIEQLKELKSTYNVLEKMLDSTLLINKSLKTQENDIINHEQKEIIVSKLSHKNSEIVDQFNLSKLDTLKREKKSISIDTVVINNSLISDSIKKENATKKETVSSEELREIVKEFRDFYFKDITRVYSNARKPRPVKLKDKYIWIEIESDYGNYKNSLRQIIHQITINGSYVNIADIKENGRRTSGGDITTYYIKLKIPKHVVFKANNRITLTADRTYTTWFRVIM